MSTHTVLGAAKDQTGEVSPFNIRAVKDGIMMNQDESAEAGSMRQLKLAESGESPEKGLTLQHPYIETHQNH